MKPSERQRVEEVKEVENHSVEVRGECFELTGMCYLASGCFTDRRNLQICH